MTERVIGPTNSEARSNSVHDRFINSVGEIVEYSPVKDNGFTQTPITLTKYAYKGLRLGGADFLISQNVPSMRLGYLHKVLYSSKMIHLEGGSGFMYPEILSEERSMKNIEPVTRSLDGAIAMSEMAKSYVEGQVDAPIEIVRPFVGDEMRQRLLEADHRTRKGKILFVGKNAYRKGLDILIEAFRLLEEDLELHIIGPEENRYETSEESIYDHGYVSLDELVKHYSTSDLFVLPARADAHPVSVLEAMLADTPVIMTENTGTNYLVENESNYLVVEPEAGEIADSIHSYFIDDLDRGRFRTKVEDEYIEQKQIQKFQEAFERFSE